MSFTVEEAKRAIYIDFEGMERTDGVRQPPWLLGTLRDLECHFYLMDPEMKILSRGVETQLSREIPDEFKDYRFSCTFETDFDAVMEDLQQRCTNGNRKLLAYSQAEEETIKMFAEPSLSADVCKKIENAKLVIQSWWRREVDAGRKKPLEKRTLKNYLRAAGYEHEVRQPANVRSKLLNGIKGTHRWKNVGDDTRKRWYDILLYNFKDCHGLEWLTRKAARFYASDQPI